MTVVGQPSRVPVFVEPITLFSGGLTFSSTNLVNLQVDAVSLAVTVSAMPNSLIWARTTSSPVPASSSVVSRLNNFSQQP